MSNVNTVIYPIVLDVANMTRSNTMIETQVGEVITLSITLTDRDDKKDLTGCKIKFACLLYKGDRSSLFYSQTDEDTENGVKLIDVIDAANGRLNIRLKKEFTSYVSSGAAEIIIEKDGYSVISNRFAIKINDSYYSNNIPDSFFSEIVNLVSLEQALKDIQDLKSVESGHTHPNYALIDHDHEQAYAAKITEHTHSNDSELNKIEPGDTEKWNNKSDFGGSYNDLADRPAIPTITNDLTDELKSKYDSAYIHSIDEHAPSNSQKNSDITKEEIEAKLKGEISSHTHNYAETTHSHSKADISDFEHTHNEYLTSVPTEYVTETELNSKGYLTQHQDISSKVDKVSGKSLISDSEITRLASVNNYNDTEVRNLIGQKADSSALHSHSNKTELDKIAIGDKAKWDAKSNFSGSYDDLTNKPTIPVITKEEIEAKLTGEITSHTHPDSGESENKSVIPLIKNELEADENEIFIVPRGTAEFTTVLNNVNVAEDGTMTIANESVAKSAAFTITKDGIFVIETTSTNTGFYYIATKINGISINGSWTKDARKYEYVVKGGDTVTINFDNGSRGYTIKAYGEAKNDIIWKANNEFVNLSVGEQNVQSDWNSTDMFSDSYIKNKPYVTDNLTSTSATNILSARQGKFLDDKITTLNNKIGDSTSGLTKNVADNTANIAQNTSALDDITNIGTADTLVGKFTATTLEGILLEIYNRLGNIPID